MRMGDVSAWVGGQALWDWVDGGVLGSVFCVLVDRVKS